MPHGDYTGNSKAALARAHAEEQALAANRMSLVSQVVEENKDQVVDLSIEQDEHVETVNPQNGEVVEVDVRDPALQKVKFRASETLDDITVGKDRTFSIKQGQTYTAPRWVVEHLDAQQLVWH